MASTMELTLKIITEDALSLRDAEKLEARADAEKKSVAELVAHFIRLGLASEAKASIPATASR